MHAREVIDEEGFGRKKVGGPSFLPIKIFSVITTSVISNLKLFHYYDFFI